MQKDKALSLHRSLPINIPSNFTKQISCKRHYDISHRLYLLYANYDSNIVQNCNTRHIHRSSEIIR